MNKTASIIIALIYVSFAGCSRQTDIVKLEDIKQYLLSENNNNSAQVKLCGDNISFWSGRLIQHPDNTFFMQKLGGFYSQRFKLKGDIDDLILSDSFLRQASLDFGDKDAALLQMLSQSALSKHEFKLAVEYARKACEIPEYNFFSRAVLWDALMETGRYDEAENVFSSFTDKTSQTYLIRASRNEEHKGNLDNAVSLIRQVYSIGEKDNDIGLQCYAKNLTAFHLLENNKPEEAYKEYLDALKLNPDYYPALEGIAAIAFAYDNKTDIAKYIYESLSQTLKSPDVYLNLSKIADDENDEIKKKNYLDTYIRLISNKQYGRMYNKYLVYLETDEFKNYFRAKEIAESEIKERPTPAAYFLLAWVNYKSGDVEQSRKIIKDKVEGKTQDADILSKIERINLDYASK